MKGQGATDRVRRLFAAAGTERAAGPDGSGPYLLTWMDVAEADSFQRAYSWIGARPLDPAEHDGYVADTARTGVEPGAPDPLGTEAEFPLPLLRLLPTEIAPVRTAAPIAHIRSVSQ